MVLKKKYNALRIDNAASNTKFIVALKHLINKSGVTFHSKVLRLTKDNNFEEDNDIELEDPLKKH